MLATLAGFTIKVAADHRSVAIKTNLVQVVSNWKIHEGKYDDSMTELLQGVTTAQEALLPQLEELLQAFTKGLNICEYDDVYVTTQSLTTEGTISDEVITEVVGFETLFME